MSQVKTLPARVKAAEDGDAPGAFSAIVAAYNTDSDGDRIIPGAFEKSLTRWKDSGNTIPIVWAHQHNDAFAHIGAIGEAAETSDGLVIKGQLDIEDNPTARQVYKLIKGGRINNYSFAYEVMDSEPATKSDEDDNGTSTLLKELEIFEAGPCLIGMNRETRTLDVKSGVLISRPDAKAVPGSFEQRQELLINALSGGGTGDGETWAYPVATFDDRVVYCLSGSEEGTYEASYTIAADGTVSLGERAEVQVTETVIPAAPKDGTTQNKAGRALSAANLTALKSAVQSIQNGVEKIEAITGVMDDDDAAENGKAQTGEPVKSDDDLTANAPGANEPDGKSDDAHAHVPAESVPDPAFELSQLEFESLLKG